MNGLERTRASTEGFVCFHLRPKSTVHKDLLHQQRGQTLCSAERGFYKNILSVALSTQCFGEPMTIEETTFSQMVKLFFFPSVWLVFDLLICIINMTQVILDKSGLNPALTTLKKKD